MMLMLCIPAWDFYSSSFSCLSESSQKNSAQQWTMTDRPMTDDAEQVHVQDLNLTVNMLNIG